MKNVILLVHFGNLEISPIDEGDNFSLRDHLSICAINVYLRAVPYIPGANISILNSSGHGHESIKCLYHESLLVKKKRKKDNC